MPKIKYKSELIQRHIYHIRNIFYFRKAVRSATILLNQINNSVIRKSQQNLDSKIISNKILIKLFNLIFLLSNLPEFVKQSTFSKMTEFFSLFAFFVSRSNIFQKCI